MMYKKILCIILSIACLTALIGCTAFQQPTGVWYCKKLELTIDFDQRLSRCVYNGVLQKKESNQKILCRLNYITGKMEIYDAATVALEDLDKSEVFTEPLYRGSLQSRGIKMRRFRLQNSWKEYIFVKIE